MTAKYVRAALVVAAALLLPIAGPHPSSAWAQPGDGDAKKAAADYFRKGTTKYNLGDWDDAVINFTKAYESYPDAAFLFNIAQAYRQAGNCKKAIFFYKRYLSEKPNTPNRAEVEGFIKDLTETCAKQQNDSEKPPTGTIDPTGTGTGTTTGTGTGTGTSTSTGTSTGTNSGTGTGTSTGTGTGTSTGTGTGTGTGTSTGTGTGTSTGTGTGTSSGTGTQVAAVEDNTSGSTAGDIGTVVTPEEPGQEPSLVVASASMGPALLGIGKLDSPAQLSLNLAAGYPLQMGPVRLELGGLVSFTRVAWESETATGTASMTSIMANAGASMELASKIRGRASLGMGSMVFAGVRDAASLFFDPDFEPTGALSHFVLRLGLGAEYELTDQLSVVAEPIAFSVSPAHGGMRDGINYIRNFQMLVGVGYRM